mmetsp:Transcript_23647/g.39676  ORF Transcript_23647/g.39676 Transcript_23647/m.39676 type:complete len:501 (+) Transcript_23647:261-1763(+)
MPGRITIFSLKTCPHCIRAKGIFKNHDWEFYDISLSDYPEKRVDMLQLSDRLTVPQIFFSDRYMGGASEIIALDEAGTLQPLYDAMLTGPAPTEPMLSMLNRPSSPPRPAPVAKPRTDADVTFGSHTATYASILVDLEKGLSIQDRTYKLTTYPKCFVGSEAVDILMSQFQLKTREEAVKAGEQLLQSGMLEHVTAEHGFQDAPLFYRLSLHRHTKVLNNVRTWTDRIDDPMVTILVVKKLFSEVQGRFTNNEGLVDYAAMAEDPKYREFQEAVCEFQRADIHVMDHNTKLAFFVNLYNVIVLHAFTELGIATSSIQRSKYFEEAKYIVGGCTLSLVDIENGILRGNRKAPYHYSKQFGNDRVSVEVLPLKYCEPRIHFALNCGAKSCPPIKTLSTGAVQEELRIVAMAFLEGETNCLVDTASNTLHLSSIFNWYAEDFGATDVDVAKFVVQFLRGAKKDSLQSMIDTNKVKKKFLVYDWTTNASNHRKFKTDSWLGVLG